MQNFSYIETSKELRWSLCLMLKLPLLIGNGLIIEQQMKKQEFYGCISTPFDFINKLILFPKKQN